MLMGSVPGSGADGAGSPERDDLGSLLSNAFAILKRRAWLILALLAAGLAIAAVILLTATPQYTATATIKVDPKGTILNGGAAQDSSGGGMPDQSVVETELSVMDSRAVAMGVVRKLNLQQDPEFARGLPPVRTPAETALRQQRIADSLLDNLNIRRQPGTYLIDVGFRSANPEKAALIADAFTQSYIASTIDRRTGTAEQQFKSLDKRLNELGQQAQAADSALAQYRASAGIASTPGGSTVTDQQIAPLSGQLASAQAAAAAAQSDLAVARQQMAAGGATAASGVLNSPAIQQLRANRSSVQQMQSQLSTRYGPRHPQTVQAEQQLQAIDAQMQEEASRIVGELETRARASSAQAGSLNGALSGLRGQQAANARSQGTADSLERDAEAKRNAYNRLAQVADQLNQLAQSSMSQAQVITPATVPSSPSSPKKVPILLVGAIGGLVAGLALVLVIELMTNSFSSVPQLERVLGLTLLATVPRLKARDMGADERSPADSLVFHPISVYAEAFRNLRSSLSAGAEQPPKVVALVSTLPDEGKTTCALSFARVLALSGEKTLVIDCDIRRAGVSALAKQRGSVGLLEVLTAGARPADAIVPDDVPGLDMLVVAEATFTPVDVFGGDNMRQLLALLGQRYDRIVLDTPPILGVTDARTLAALADAVVLVVKWQSTARKAVKSAVDWLRLDQAPLAGAMLTMVSRKAEAYGAMYYSRKYANYYQKA